MYIVIFLVIWFFMTRYQYKLWQYLLLIGLGQALGDGGFYFVAAPFMLPFLPYVMVNYHAMNFVPYLLAKDSIKPKRFGWAKYVLPPVVIIITYLILGGAIHLIGVLTGLK